MRLIRWYLNFQEFSIEGNIGKNISHIDVNICQHFHRVYLVKGSLNALDWLQKNVYKGEATYLLSRAEKGEMTYSHLTFLCIHKWGFKYTNNYGFHGGKH